MNKTFITIIVAGLLLGVTFLGIEIVFELPKEVVWKYYVITSVVIVVGVVIFTIRRQMKFFRKLQSLEKILREERDTDKFIEGNKGLLQQVKSDDQKTTIKINLSAGYCDKGEFKKAKDVLLSINVNDLKGIQKVFYHINLAYAYFKLEDNEKGLDILEKNYNNFLKYENRPSLSSSIAVLKIFGLLAQNNVSEAQALLTASKDKFNDELLSKEWLYLESKIAENK